MLGERRSNSLFAPAAPAEPERKPEQAEVHDISFEERTGRSLFAEATTAPRASELFFAPQEKGVTFAEALSQVQGYLSETNLCDDDLSQRIDVSGGVSPQAGIDFPPERGQAVGTASECMAGLSECGCR